MKKIFLIFLILSLTLPGFSFGQSPSPAQNGEDSSIKIQVDEIKDKVTTQVEKLNLVEKRGLVGVVESISENQIRINDLNDKVRIIDVDELTDYSSESSSSFDFSDIEEGTKISVIGLYNKDSEKLLARFVNEISIPLFLSGVISDTNGEDFTITLSTEEEKHYTVDIENITRVFSFSEEDLSQSGFSELEVLQNAIVVGFSDPDEENRVTATRVIVFPEIPQNPQIEIDIPEPESDISSSPAL